MAAWRRPVEAFRKWWSRQSASKRERWRLAAVLVVLALLLLVIVFALWRTAALTALFLAPVALCLVVLGLLGPNAREWLIEHVIPIGALLLSGWLLGAFGLWAVVNTVWAGQARPPAQDHAPLTVAGVPLTATAAYPAVALADATDDALTLSFSAGAVPLPRQYVTATVTLPATLAFAAAGGPSTRDFLVPLTAGQPGSRRIGIVNNGVYEGRRGREETIAVRLCAGPGNCTADDLTLTVRPEGRDGYAIRRFVNSTIDQSSPIILLLLFLVPGLAVLGQRLLNDQRTALQKRRADECDRFIKRFRSHLRTEAIGHAAEDLQELGKTRYSELRVEEREFARKLHQLAIWRYPPPPSADAADLKRGQWPDREVLSKFFQYPDWAHELITAAILAYRQLIDPALEQYYDERGGGYDFHREIVPELHKFHDKVWSAVMGISLADDDPLKAERHKTDRARAEALISRRPVMHKMGLSAYTTADRRLITPFALGDASKTEESRFLTDGQAFWGNHPLLRHLRRGDHSVVVSGAKGSGRTALAQILPLEYVHDPADLFVHLEAGVKRPAIVRQVAKQLWHFILQQPLFLSRCDREPKQGLATFLAAGLGKRRLDTDLHDILERLNRNQTLRENIEAATQLTTLGNMLPSASASLDLDGDDWFHTFLEPAKILGFVNVVFVITIHRAHVAWLEKLADFKTLQESHVHVWLFIDDEARDAITFMLDETRRVVNDLCLSWEEKDLPAFRAMLDWRYEKYLDAANLLSPRERRRALGTCFDDEDDLSRLIAASKVNGEYNPRRFMRLWRAAVGDKVVGQTITAADVDRALDVDRAPAADRTPAGGGDP